MKTYTKDELARYLESVIHETYYNYWNLSESEFPILDHTVFITYRLVDAGRPKEAMISGFHRWTREMIKNLMVKHDDRVWVYSRQPVGMFAMDYNGSTGRKRVDDRVGPHVHAVLVLHPDLRMDFERELSIKEDEHVTFRRRKKNKNYLDYSIFSSNHKFWWARHDQRKSMHETIKYNLKGIMHKNGFHSGREDQYNWIMPDLTKEFRQEKQVFDKWGLSLLGL